jgi:hypothetical protein
MRGTDDEALTSTVGLYQDLRQTGTESPWSQPSHPRDSPEGWTAQIPYKVGTVFHSEHVAFDAGAWVFPAAV